MADHPQDPGAATPRGLHGQRASRSADASRRLELERLAQLSAYERVLLALDLAAIREVCSRHGEGAALEQLLEELGLAPRGGA